jgi:HSP20 family molecular chaperone IbpA
MSALREAFRDLPDTVFADLLESDDAYLLVVDLPGTTAETVDVSVEERRLVVEARREKAFPPAFRFLQEDRSLFLDAELPLPGDATDEGATAAVEDGVLEVQLPKQAAAAATTIDVEEPGDDHDDADG